MAGPSFAEDSVTLQGSVFGTTYTIKARGASIDKPALATAITKRLDDVDQRMSTWRDDSDVSQFNRSRSTDWFPVNVETACVVELANQISRETEGQFDITVGPAVRLWNFGSAARLGFILPTDEQIRAVQSVVGYEKLAVRLDPPALRKTTAAVEIDLSAIAKGYGVDVVSELLTDKSIEHFMVEIGGEVRACGRNEEGNSWRIGLESPQRSLRKIDAIISLDNRSLATSGDYRNYFQHDGITYSHTIHPKTASPVEHRLASVTVLADDCSRADALATAILAMGPERGQTWAEANQITAMLLTRSGDRVDRTMTKDFPSLDCQPQANGDGSANTSNFFPIFLTTAAVFGIAVLAMSIGAIVANRRLQGSCGGMAGLKDAGGKTICDMCTKPSPECSGDPEASDPASH